MGGFIAPSTTIGGTVLAPGIPLFTSPRGGLYELPELNGIGFAMNQLNYWTMTALGFSFGNRPSPAYAVAFASNTALTGGGTLPRGGTFSPDGNFVVIPCQFGSVISVFIRNNHTNALTQVPGSPFALGGGGAQPYDATFTPDGGTLYIAAWGSTAIQKYSFNKATGVPTFQFNIILAGAAPTCMAMTSDAAYMFSSGQGSGIWSINLTSNIATQMVVGTTSFGCALTPDNQYLYVPQSGGGVLGYSNQGGVLTPLAGSPFATPGSAALWRCSVSSDGNFLIVPCANNANLNVFRINKTTGSITPVVGSPFAVTADANDAFVTKDMQHIVGVTNGTASLFVRTFNALTGAVGPDIAGSPFALVGQCFRGQESPDGYAYMAVVSTVSAIELFSTTANPTFNLIQATYDPLGLAGGTFNINGGLFLNGAPVLSQAASPADGGKFLRLNNVGQSLWDGVNTYLPVAMVANAGAFSVDDTAEYIVEVTGALTGNGALTATFTIPADPLKIVFDNVTTGGFPLILNATYTIPPGRSFWYWNGATLEKISSGGFRTANVTPLPAGGAVVAVNHLCGAIPSSVIVEAVCLTAELGFSIGDVIQQVPQFNGVALYYGIDPWMNATQVGFTLTAGNAMGSGSRTNGALSTLTAANWAYRFAIVP